MLHTDILNFNVFFLIILLQEGRGFRNTEMSIRVSFSFLKIVGEMCRRNWKGPLPTTARRETAITEHTAVSSEFNGKKLISRCESINLLAHLQSRHKRRQFFRIVAMNIFIEISEGCRVTTVWQWLMSGHNVTID